MAEGMHQLGKYRIAEELGSGGFATVFKAVDTTLDREVALKILHPPLLADRRFVQNFRQEAKTLAALRHPQIITIYEVGEIDGRIFIAMELARGLNLAKAIAKRHNRQRIAWEETLELLRPICEALDYAHRRQVVHRDLKPANILIDSQRGALLTDFGFARLMAENSASMSVSGGIAGTPGYIAPEVWENNAADLPVDIYALGCIVYEMLTGDVLFKGQTPIQAMRAHDRGPQFPATWPEDTVAGIADVLRTALAREPAARYPSAGAFWRALNDLEAQAQAEREAAQRAELAKRETARRTEEAQREAAQRAAVATQWRAEAERALAEHNVTAAKLALEHWRANAPDDPVIPQMQARLERLEIPQNLPLTTKLQTISQAPSLTRQVTKKSKQTYLNEEAKSQPMPHTKSRSKGIIEVIMGGFLILMLIVVIIYVRTLRSSIISATPTASVASSVDTDTPRTSVAHPTNAPVITQATTPTEATIPTQTVNDSGSLLYKETFDKAGSDFNEDETANASYKFINGAYSISAKKPNLIVWQKIKGDYGNTAISLDTTIEGPPISAAGLIFPRSANPA